MQKKLIVLLFVVLPIVAVLSIIEWGRQPSPEEFRTKRLASLPPKEPITFGVLWSDGQGKSSFFEGVQIAADEINSNGGLLGRKVETIHRQFGSGYLENMNAVYELNEVPGLSLILGFPPFRTTRLHLGLARYYGIPALINSQEESLMRGAWNRELAARGNASTAFIAETISTTCQNNGYDYVMLVRRAAEYDDFFAELADLATNQLLMKGIRLDSIVLDPLEKLTAESLVVEQLRNIEAEKEGARFGAVILAANTDDVLDLSRLLMEKTSIESMVTYVDFYETGNLDWIKKMSNLPKKFYIISSVLNQKEVQQKQVPEFVTQYYKRFRHLPTKWSIAGYDQAKLVAQAIQNGDSILPRDIMREIRAIHYDGITQDYSFTGRGELETPDISILQAKDLDEVSQIIHRFKASLGLESSQTIETPHENSPIRVQ